MKLVERVKSAIKHRNNFSLSYEGVLTADFGDFVPIVCKEMVPTDSFTTDSLCFFRLNALASPTFGRIHAYVNSFYVPTRILMPDNEYEDSMTGGVDGDYPETFPFITYAALYGIYRELQVNWIEDNSPKRFRKLLSYLGLGNIIGEIEDVVLVDGEVDIERWQALNDEKHSISLLPFLALFRIFYDYYAPLNLEDDNELRAVYTRKYKGLITYRDFDPEGFPYGDTDLAYFMQACALLATCYNKDYFTMAMTRPQRGAASIVPVDGEGGSVISGTYTMQGDANGELKTGAVFGQSDAGSHRVNFNGFASGSGSGVANSISGNSVPLSPELNNHLQTTYETQFGSEGDIRIVGATGSAGYFKVQTARLAQKMQAFLERNNIAGGRFFEQMAARFGVKFSAAALQRSEYLGGHDFWIKVSDVTSTASTEDASLGELAGKGIGAGSHRCSFYSNDYGFFISLLHFVPETFGLVDGLDRMFTRRSRFDYWQPEMEDTGMQPVYNKELNMRLTVHDIVPDETANPDGVFGYNPRCAEYKTANPILAGDFVLSDNPLSVPFYDSYHLFRRIGNVESTETPVLNRDFVSILGIRAGQNNFNRIFQNTTSDFDHFVINTQLSIGCNRPMIGYAEAGLEFSHEEAGNKSVTLAYGGDRK